MRARGVMLAILLALAPSPAGAQPERRPVLLRLEGHVGARRPDDRGLATLTFRRGKSIIELQVDEIWVLSGDAVGLDILAEVEPYRPSMSLSGTRELLDRLQHARPEERLDVTGYFRRGVRLFMLSGVEPAKARKGRR